VPTLLALFLAPAFAPVPLLTGWIHAAARANPITYFLESGRGFVAGTPFDVAITFGMLAALVALLAGWTATGLRRAVRTV
jgi:ABC-type multidrug transport system permease subunit